MGTTIYLLHVFAIIINYSESFCQETFGTEVSISHQFLNFGPKKIKTTVMMTKDPHHEFLETLMKNMNNVFGEWDHTDGTTKTSLHYDVMDEDSDFRNLNQGNISLKQFKDEKMPLKYIDVPGFAAAPQHKTAKTLIIHEKPFSPRSLFPMTRPLNTLLRNSAIESNETRTTQFNSKNVSNMYRSCIFCNNLENTYCSNPRNMR